MMLFFCFRKKIEQEYYKWIKSTKAKDCPFNVISFLFIKELIDEEKAINFISSIEMEE